MQSFQATFECPPTFNCTNIDLALTLLSSSNSVKTRSIQYRELKIHGSSKANELFDIWDLVISSYADPKAQTSTLGKWSNDELQGWWTLRHSGHMPVNVRKILQQSDRFGGVLPPTGTLKVQVLTVEDQIRSRSLRWGLRQLDRTVEWEDVGFESAMGDIRKWELHCELHFSAL